MELSLPLTKEKVKTLKIGDVVYLTGYAYTCRDAAHKRIQTALQKGEKSPIDWTDQTIFYAGPCPTKPGKTTGSIGPTTSARMDPFAEMMFQQGLVAMIGKGKRADFIPDLCKKYGGVYLLGIGGASAINTQQIKSIEVVEYEDLGTESIKKLYFDRFRVIVGIDTTGDVLYEREIQKYKR